MNYVEGFVVPVPTKNLAKHKRFARKMDRVWLEHGALECHECVADDVKPGKLTSFPQAVQLKRNETVIFSWIVFKSRAHRDRVMKEIMADPRMTGIKPKDLPFDGLRMFWGGFKEIISVAR